MKVAFGIDLHIVPQIKFKQQDLTRMIIEHKLALFWLATSPACFGELI